MSEEMPGSLWSGLFVVRLLFPCFLLCPVKLYVDRSIDALIQKGEIEEFGVFPDGNSGYGIGKGETADVYRGISMFQPYILSEVHEIIPYEKHKQIIGALLKAQISAAPTQR